MKKTNKTLKNSENAITLIALVVTIIVILILASISIGMLMGEDGIIKRAGESKINSDIAQEKEVLSLSYNGVASEKKSKGDFSVVKAKELNNQLKADGVNAYAKGNTSITVIFNESNRKYIINGEGIEYKGIVTNKKQEMLEIGDKVLYNPIESDESSSWLEDSVDGYDANSKKYYTSSKYNGNKSATFEKENLDTWKIWNIDEENGIVEVISGKETSIGLPLVGVVGYNNAVFLINDICEKLYSNSNLGAVARGFNTNDMEKK